MIDFGALITIDKGADVRNTIYFFVQEAFAWFVNMHHGVGGSSVSTLKGISTIPGDPNTFRAILGGRDTWSGF